VVNKWDCGQSGRSSLETYDTCIFKRPNYISDEFHGFSQIDLGLIFSGTKQAN